MKGSEGVADTQAALNTLFEALLTLCRTTSSFAPFMTETIYQRLRPFIPEGAAAAGDDTRSVHFLSFPEPKAAYADEKVQVAVRRLLAVINVGRKLREEKGLDLKVRITSSSCFLSRQRADSDALLYRRRRCRS